MWAVLAHSSGTGKTSPSDTSDLPALVPFAVAAEAGAAQRRMGDVRPMATLAIACKRAEVPPMLRRTAIILAAGLGLAGCGGAAPHGSVPGAAAESASRLLTAAFTGDRVAFEA